MKHIDDTPVTPHKRGRGRPRKTPVAPSMVEEAQETAAIAEYNPGFWYLEPVPWDDYREFEKYLCAQRELYASGAINSELIVWEDYLIRSAVENDPFGFTPENLLRIACGYRQPLMHKGEPTPSGIVKAQTLLVRDRLLAGTVTNRKPDYSKLKDVLSPLLLELIERCG